MKEAIKLIFSWVWVYLKPIFVVLSRKASKELLEITMEFVQEAATNPNLSTGEQRRQWVAEQLKHADLSTGQEIPDRVINLLIEIAVNKLTEDK